MRRGIQIVIGSLVASSVGLPAEAQWVSKVVTARTESRSMPITLTLVGTVEPVTRSLLGAEVAGLVVEMPVRQGDLVEQGQVICRLDDAILSLEVAREEGRLRALQARLDELENGTRPEELAWLKAEFEAAQALAERAAFELERIRRLQGSDFANEKEYQDALAQKLSAENMRLAAKARYDEGLAGPRTEVRAAARFAVEEQKAAVERLKTNLAKTRIMAPFSGHIIMRHTEVGQWVQMGGPVAEMVDLSSVLVVVDVPERAIPFATVGAPTRVYFDALQEAFDGTIKHVIPQADRSARTFPVEVEIDNPEYALRSGLFARATVPAGPTAETVAVMKDAIIEHGGVTYVAVITQGKEGPSAMPIAVTLGSDAGEWVAITSGNIKPGTEVAIHGNERLVFPQPVQIVRSVNDLDDKREIPINTAQPDAAAGENNG